MSSERLEIDKRPIVERCPTQRRMTGKNEKVWTTAQTSETDKYLRGHLNNFGARRGVMRLKRVMMKLV